MFVDNVVCNVLIWLALVFGGIIFICLTFEIRKNDRDFKVGDLVHFVDTNGIEFLPCEVHDIHDKENEFKINFVLHDNDWKDVPKGFCIFSLERCK